MPEGQSKQLYLDWFREEGYGYDGYDIANDGETQFAVGAAV